jgi:hypothetical protein
MRSPRPAPLLGFALLALAAPRAASASSADLALFSASGGVPPNILLLLDSSGSMGKEPAGCAGLPGCDRKRDLANQAIADLVRAVNPSDGSGGYANNARFGFSIFTGQGARVLVPIGEDTTDDILTWVLQPNLEDAADNINSIGGNSHGLANMDTARYLAHPKTFGPFPPFGFASPFYSGPPYTGDATAGQFPNEDPRLPGPFDLACRPTSVILIDDGLWGGNDGARFGDCPDMNGDGSSDTCPLEFIGDSSGDGEFWTEDVTQKMYETDFRPDMDGLQNVITHVISFDAPQAADLMRIAAQLGGGLFHFADDGAELSAALLNSVVNVFEGIASFASVAVPASRTESGSFLYNAYFEPKANEAVWAGHLEAYRLGGDGTILDKDGNPATDADGNLNDPPNPYWDAAYRLKTQATRYLFTSKAGGRVPFDTANLTADDLGLETDDDVPEPPPDPCAPTPASLPAGYWLGFPSLTAPYAVKPGTKVKIRYCVPAARKGIKKDFIGFYFTGEEGTDAISLFERGDKDATGCTFGADGKPTAGYKEKDLSVGKAEGRIEARLYLANNFTPAGLAAWSESICVDSDAGGTPPPPPPPNPDFAPYPNSKTSGIDTYEELRQAVIAFAQGKDAFDQDADGSKTDTREVVLGDIFHSTPLIVPGVPRSSLESEDGFTAFRDAYKTRNRVIYVGANDGMLHAFHGGVWQTGDDPSTPEVESGYYTPGTGDEVFGYVPGLLLPEIKMLSRNNPRSTYYVDGSPVAADVWLGNGNPSDVSKSADEWATVLLTGFREGGPGYLALDVTEPGAVAGAHGPYPKLLWEFTHAKLAAAWSSPVIVRLKTRGSSGSGDHCGLDDGEGDCRERWVAIFGGGYQQAADPNHLLFADDAGDPTWSPAGRAIFMVALDTGELLDSVEYDASGATGPSEMLYALPSAPAVLDSDGDGFADVAYVGDIGGQMWKWDLSAVGANTSGDARIDNWPAGVFFRSAPTTLSGGETRYRSMFFPPSAAFVRGKLTLAFGTGEREDLHDEGDPLADDNNRFYVVEDAFPTGTGAFPGALTEASLTDVTSTDQDGNLADKGFFFKVADGEKFVTDATIFAGKVIVASYSPSSGADLCETAGGQAFLYIVDVATAQGFFAEDGEPPSEDRRTVIGGGLPSSPKVSVAPDPEDDRIYIKTSTGQVLVIDAPPRPETPGSLIYWRQKF